MTCKFLFKGHIKIITVVQYWRIKMQIFVHFLYILRPLEENNLQIKSNYHLCNYAEKNLNKLSDLIISNKKRHYVRIRGEILSNWIGSCALVVDYWSNCHFFLLFLAW